MRPSSPSKTRSRESLSASLRGLIGAVLGAHAEQHHETGPDLADELAVDGHGGRADALDQGPHGALRGGRFRRGHGGLENRLGKGIDPGGWRFALDVHWTVYGLAVLTFPDG